MARIKHILFALLTSLLFWTGVASPVQANSDVSSQVSLVNDSEVNVLLTNTSDRELTNLEIDISLPDGLSLAEPPPTTWDKLEAGESLSFPVRVKEDALEQSSTNSDEDSSSSSSASSSGTSSSGTSSSETRSSSTDSQSGQTPATGGQTSQTPKAKTASILPKTGEEWALYGAFGALFLLLAVVLWKMKLGRKVLLPLLVVATIGWSGFRTVTAEAERRQADFTHQVTLKDKLRDIKILVRYDYPKAPPVTETSSSSEESSASTDSTSQAISSSSTTPASSSTASSSEVTSPSSSTEASSGQDNKDPNKPEATDSEVLVSGYAYGADGQALKLQELSLFLDGQLVSNLVTEEEDGYFLFQAIKGRTYRIQGAGFEVSLIANGDNDYQVINHVGQLSLGKVIADETSRVAVQPEVAYVEDFTMYSVEGDGAIVVDKAYDLHAGDKIILPPSADFNTGVAYRVVSSEVIDGQTHITGEIITDLSEILTELQFSDTITTEEFTFTPAGGVEVVGLETGNRSNELVADVADGKLKAIKKFDNGLSLALELKYKISPEIKINWLNIPQTKALVDSQVEVALIGALEAEQKKDELLDAAFPLGTMTFVTPQGIKVVGDVKAFLTTKNTGELELKAGIEFKSRLGLDQGNWVKDFSATPKFEAKLAEKTGLEAGIELLPGLEAFNIRAVEMSNRFGIEGEAELATERPGKEGDGLYLNFEGNPFYSAKFSVPEIAKVNQKWGTLDVAKVKLAPKFKYSHLLQRLGTESSSSSSSTESSSSTASSSEASSSTTSSSSETPGSSSETEGTGTGTETPTTPPTPTIGQPNAESDFEWKEVPGGVEITRYKGTRPDLVIPSSLGGLPVVAIGDFTYLNWRNERGISLRSLVVPEGVVSIGSSAFSSNQLRSVVLPSSLREIGRGAFFGNQLTAIDLPAGLTGLGDSAFSSNMIRSVVIPAGITRIDYRTFANNHLTSVGLPEGLTDIGEGAFDHNHLTEIALPSTLTDIGVIAFSSNRLRSLTLPPGLTTIGSKAFSNNQIAGHLLIPEGVIKVGLGAFRDNNLTEVTLPSTLSAIQDVVFSANKLTSVVIPEGVTTVHISAFLGNSLTSLYLSDSVTEFYYFGDSQLPAFDLSVPSHLKDKFKTTYMRDVNITYRP